MSWFPEEYVNIISLFKTIVLQRNIILKRERERCDTAFPCTDILNDPLLSETDTMPSSPFQINKESLRKNVETL